MKALLIICNIKEIDLVGYNVFNYYKNNYQLKLVDTNEELSLEVYEINKDNNYFYLLITKEHVMHHYIKYADYMYDNYKDVDICLHMNYHAGTNAPDKILSLHTVGDVVSSVYLPTNPVLATNILYYLDKLNNEYQLNYHITTEACHYSGITTNNNPTDLLMFSIPTYDLEIGSTIDSYNNELAIKIICESALNMFNDIINKELVNVLYLGGMHFEENLNKAIFNHEYPIYYNQQLAGFNIEKANYYVVGYDHIINIIKKASIPVDLIVYHDKVRKIKPILDKIEKEYGILSIKHRALRNIDTNKKLIELFDSKKV